MGIHKHINTLLIAVLVILISGATPLFAQNHIKELDVIRTSMTSLGNEMPALIKNAKATDIRTLERVFEINTYALTTIESYFKMIKVAVSSGGEINKDIIKILNGWLQFINKYCQKDIEYFDEALADTQDKAIIDLIQKAKKNVSTLGDVAEKGIKENDALLER